ncbi:MAG TPA: hypothetical protein VI540_00770 [Gaiellaceae bacterium]|nr:hypothetical protein [Gaiellaceae bacterium]
MRSCRASMWVVPGTVWAALVALAAFSGDPRAERAARLTVTPAAAG